MEWPLGQRMRTGTLIKATDMARLGGSVILPDRLVGKLMPL